jgi:hypothetical protein
MWLDPDLLWAHVEVAHPGEESNLGTQSQRSPGTIKMLQHPNRRSLAGDHRGLGTGLT